MNIKKKIVLSLDGDIVSLYTLKRRLGDYKQWGSQEIIADTYKDRILYDDREKNELTQEELDYLIPPKK
jgi:hypothetical protein